MLANVHALRILRAHGMTASSVHIDFKSVVVAKLVYAGSSWWGDTKDTKYHLRPRSHNLKLTVKNSYISQSDFITRMLFKVIY